MVRGKSTRQLTGVDVLIFALEGSIPVAANENLSGVL
jgi:hypothetical protein